jgi:uncharacterized Zn finger protein
MAWYHEDAYPPYVPVAERRRIAARKLAGLRKQGLTPMPVQVEGPTIARTVWGQAWCKHLEGYADAFSRLERGRTYVRNGSVIHLEVRPGALKALVSGSEVYEAQATFKPLPPARWKALVEACAGQVASVVELLSGRLSQPVMDVLCDRQKGLFPSPGEISFRCSCPDAASMCKHLAAVLYGMGARLDTAPELLFTLRKVDASALVARAATGLSARGPAPKEALQVGGEGLAGLFGIELAGGESAQAGAGPVPARRTRQAAVPLERPRAKRPAPVAQGKRSRKASPRTASSGVPAAKPPPPRSRAGRKGARAGRGRKA